MTHPTDQTEAEVPEVDEDLVAYLDGELDDEGIHRVEARLAADAAYRQELARLQSAWDCLDVLPETNIDPTFTRSTIEMVALAAEEELAAARTALPRMQRRRRLGTAALMLAGLVLGFVMVTVLWPSPTRQLARDLPVLENLDLYLPIDNLAYLQDLSALKNLPALEGLREDARPAATDAATSNPAQATPAKTISNESPQVRLTQLTSTEKAQLAASEQRFARLQPAEQTRLRDLAAVVEQAPNRDQLRDTLTRYHAWLADLSPGEQAELAGLAPPERLKAVEKLLAEQQARRARELSADDRKVLLTFLETYVVVHREELMKVVPDSRRREFTRMLEQAKPEHQSGMLIMMFWQQSRYTGQPPKLPVPSEEELRPLLANLSPAARQQLDQLENKEERRRLMQSWVGSTIRHRMMERVSTRDARQISQEQLEKFFTQEISSEERARLLAMPREEMDRELRRLMLAGEDTPGWRGFDGGRPPGGFHREGFGPPGHPGEHGPGGFRIENHPGAGHGPDDRPGHPPFRPRGEGFEGDHPRGDGPRSDGKRFERGSRREGEFGPEGGRGPEERGPEGDPRRFGRPGDGFRSQQPEPSENRPGEKDSPEADEPKVSEPANEAKSV
jgi:hypothetical protein